MRSALGLPEPNTTCVRPCASAQRVQVAVSSACARSAAARSTASIGRPVYGVTRMVIRVRGVGRLVTAAARAAAAPAAAARRAAERRLRRGAVHREAGELLQDLRSTALGTGDRLVARADELIEVRLALHARVLVDRHAPSVLSRACRGGALRRSRVASCGSSRSGRNTRRRSGWHRATRGRGAG